MHTLELSSALPLKLIFQLLLLTRQQTFELHLSLSPQLTIQVLASSALQMTVHHLHISWHLNCIRHFLFNWHLNSFSTLILWLLNTSNPFRSSALNIQKTSISSSKANNVHCLYTIYSCTTAFSAYNSPDTSTDIFTISFNGQVSVNTYKEFDSGMLLLSMHTHRNRHNNTLKIVNRTTVVQRVLE